VLNGIKEDWAHLSVGDRIALVLAETVVVAGCVVMSVATATDWTSAIAVVAIVFLFLQVSVSVAAIAVIRSRRRAAKRAAKGIGFWRGVLVWIVLGLLYGAGAYVADWIFPESEWATKWRYSLDSELRNADFVFDKHPHDCEFLSAPMGDKHCHYDKVVATIRIRNGQSGREMSHDDGRTWSPAESGDRATVFVSWNKVDE